MQPNFPTPSEFIELYLVWQTIAHVTWYTLMLFVYPEYLPDFFQSLAWVDLVCNVDGGILGQVTQGERMEIGRMVDYVVLLTDQYVSDGTFQGHLTSEQLGHIRGILNSAHDALKVWGVTPTVLPASNADVLIALQHLGNMTPEQIDHLHLLLDQVRSYRDGSADAASLTTSTGVQVALR